MKTILDIIKPIRLLAGSHADTATIGISFLDKALPPQQEFPAEVLDRAQKLAELA